MNKVTLEEVLYLQAKFEETKDEIYKRRFASDNQAIEAGLKQGDFYLVTPMVKPYHLPDGMIKTVV